MLTLETRKWVRYEPSIPGNLEAPPSDRFFLELSAGMTFERFEKLRSAMRLREGEDPKAWAERMVSELEDVVRLGATPLSLDGAPVQTLAHYLRPVMNQTGAALWQELCRRLFEINSWEGSREVFCVRPSGSSAGTPSPTTASAAAPTAG